MIISRTPLRMSFVGGGSDMRSFYREEVGAVLSTAIDKYIFVTASRKFDEGVRVAYSRTEEVSRSSEVEHKIVRAGLDCMNIRGGIEITTVADIPAKGTGLGSSSTFAVGLLHALHAFTGQYANRETLAAGSCRIEIDICGEPIGKQDQYAAAYGGLNLFEFMPDETVKVSPITCGNAVIEDLSRHILVLYTGITRSASALLASQNSAIEEKKDARVALRRMVQLAYDMKAELEKGNLSSIGEILHENWSLKKSLANGISNGEIDDWYQAGLNKGATGGKILGAGAGGFLMFFAPPHTHDAIAHSLPGLRRIQIGLERLGSQIIFYNP